MDVLDDCDALDIYASHVSNIATNVQIRECRLADHREDVGVCKYRLAGNCAEMWRFENAICGACIAQIKYAAEDVVRTWGMSSRSGSSCMCRKSRMLDFGNNYVLRAIALKHAAEMQRFGNNNWLITALNEPMRMRNS